MKKLDRINVKNIPPGVLHQANEIDPVYQTALYLSLTTWGPHWKHTRRQNDPLLLDVCPFVT